MEVKKKKDMMIPQSDSFKGLSVNDWEKLNDGQKVKLDEIPELVKPYLAYAVFLGHITWLVLRCL